MKGYILKDNNTGVISEFMLDEENSRVIVINDEIDAWTYVWNHIGDKTLTEHLLSTNSSTFAEKMLIGKADDRRECFDLDAALIELFKDVCDNEEIMKLHSVREVLDAMQSIDEHIDTAIAWNIAMDSFVEYLGCDDYSSDAFYYLDDAPTKPSKEFQTLVKLHQDFCEQCR